MFEDDVDRASFCDIDDFAETAIWTPVSTGDSVSVSVIFSDEFIEANFGDGSIAGEEPYVYGLASKFPGAARGDRFFIRGSTYLIKSKPRKQDSGFLMIYLKGPVDLSGIELEDGSGNIGLENDSGEIIQQ